jgi:hypothetical protein
MKIKNETNDTLIITKNEIIFIISGETYNFTFNDIKQIRYNKHNATFYRFFVNNGISAISKHSGIPITYYNTLSITIYDDSTLDADVCFIKEIPFENKVILFRFTLADKKQINKVAKVLDNYSLERI